MKTNSIEFTVEEVKALLGCISSQLMIMNELQTQEPKLKPIRKALESAFHKIETAALGGKN